MRLRPLLALLFAALLPLVAACGDDHPRVGAVLALQGNADAGKDLYTSNCTGCHGTSGKGGSAGKDIAHVARNEPEDAIEAIVEGEDSMPAFDSLSDQDVADIIAYLKTL